MNRLACLFFLLSLLIPAATLAQIVEGRIIDTDGKPLPYSSVFSEATSSGTTSNAQGYYEMRLPEGPQELTFQHLGYATQVELVVVPEEGKVQRDVVLRKVAYSLGEAVVKKGDEDPAYPIMRKAIAKAKYHTQQLESYTAKVYMKGSGGLKEIPFLFRKSLEKEGVDTSFSFVSETITEVSYERPGKYTEEVISVRSYGNNNESSPVRYINGSFYEPKVASVVSPLAPKAFAYYKFRYINTFEERGYQINRIEVIPRSPGEDVVSGELMLVEGLWSIHSLDFNANLRGIDLDMQQTFAPIREHVWLPVSHLYEGDGSLFGFKFDFTYVATVSDYEIELNQELPEDIEVIDNKTEDEEASEADKQLDQFKSVEEKLSKGDEVSQKELRRLMRKYEKQARRKEGDVDVVKEINVKTDSTDYKADSTFWAERRPIPLTDREALGYQKLDSMAIAEEKEAEGDTLGGDKFNVTDILMGGFYRLGENDALRIHSPLYTASFNTVDGFNGDYAVSYYRRFNKFTRLQIKPQVRYANARKYWSGFLDMNLKYGNHPRQNSIALRGGRYYRQLNGKEPISPFANAMYSLWAEENYMKIYDRDFAGIEWSQHLTDQLTLNLGGIISDRTLPPNYTDFAIIDDDTRTYSPNRPSPQFTGDFFPNHRAVWAKAGLAWRPMEKYYLRNGRKEIYSGSFPRIEMELRQGIPDVLDSDVEFTALSGGIAHRFDLSRFGDLGIALRGGTFLADDQVYFPDYNHFMGNQTFFAPSQQLQRFYYLPYYRFSNSGDYYSGMVNYTFRRFLLSRIRALHISGLREHINVNYLKTDDVEHAEIGFSITNIFRLFRLDFATTYRDWNFDNFVVQFGISSDIVSFGE